MSLSFYMDSQCKSIPHGWSIYYVVSLKLPLPTVLFPVLLDLAFGNKYKKSRFKSPPSNKSRF